MKVQANGISFNCKIEGKRGAPWVDQDSAT